MPLRLIVIKPAIAGIFRVDLEGLWPESPADLSFSEEPIMEWFSQNWVWVLFSVAFIAMHMFGHGGHGGHGDGHDDSNPASNQGVQGTSDQSSRHRH